MCYHTSNPQSEVLKQFVGSNIKVLPYPETHCANGFEQPLLPVLTNRESDTVQPVTWDFTPPGQLFSYTLLNARCETLFQLPTWAESARERRCLVFVKGFFEWKKVSPTNKSKKDPYYIDRTDTGVFTMGGIWKEVADGRGSFKKRMAIITTPANQLMTELRPEVPRMPYIIERSEWGDWLDDRTTQAQLIELMRPLPDGLLRTVKLSESPLKKKQGGTLF